MHAHALQGEIELASQYTDTESKALDTYLVNRPVFTIMNICRIPS